VSKNALAGIRVCSIEDKPWRQRPSKLAQASQGAFPTLVAAHFEHASAHHPYFDLIALFEFKRLNHGDRQPNGQAVSPL